jgi:hypothetical protein
MKMPMKNSTKNPGRTSSPRDTNRCAFESSDGRRCRMLRYDAHPALCPFHAHEERQLLEAERLGSEIASSVSGAFRTATDINFVLGKLFIAFAQRRIPPRTAATLAYIAQLMLHTLPNIKEEYPFYYKFESWNKMLDKATVLTYPKSASAHGPASASDPRNNAATPSQDNSATPPQNNSATPSQDTSYTPSQDTSSPPQES